MTGGATMDVETLLVRASVEDLIGAYVGAVDRGRTDAFCALFAQDGVWEIPGETFDAGRSEGHAAIADHIEKLKRSASADPTPFLRHHVASIRVSVDGPSRARADSYFVAFTEAGPDHWGRYRDVMALESGHWRFEHRTVLHEGRVRGGWFERCDARRASPRE